MTPPFQFGLGRLLASVALACVALALFRWFFTATPLFPILAAGTVAACGAYLLLLHNAGRRDLIALATWLALIIAIYAVVALAVRR